MPLADKQKRMEAIAVQNLNISYGRRKNKVNAVSNVSFSFGIGTSFGLVGESGSGKSTVLHSIAGLLEDWSGEILVDGDAQMLHRQTSFYRIVQLVFQDYLYYLSSFVISKTLHVRFFLILSVIFNNFK